MNRGKLTLDERKHNWYPIQPPAHHLFFEANKWCVEFQSSGQYQHNFDTQNWWFENKDDAVIFALLWAR